MSVPRPIGQGVDYHPSIENAVGHIPCHPDRGTIMELVDAELARQLGRDVEKLAKALIFYALATPEQLKRDKGKRAMKALNWKESK